MNTQFALLAIYEKTDIPLEVVAKDYLNMEPAGAKKKALRQQLPFPAYRAPGQKSQWLVNVADLAEFIDRERAKAANDWEAMNAA